MSAKRGACKLHSTFVVIFGRIAEWVWRYAASRIAVTPMPPAVQIETRPRPPPFS